MHWPLLLVLFLGLSHCSPEPIRPDAEQGYPPGTGLDTRVERSAVDRIIDLLYRPDTSYVLVGTHRGAWRSAPENTLPAIEHCIDMGVEIVEIDVRQTFDGHLVVIHDSSLDRTTNGTGKIAERTLAYIRSLRTKDHTGRLTDIPVPTLSEVMLTAKGRVLIMIDKGNDYFAEIQAVLIETKTVDHGLFIEPYTWPDARKVVGDFLLENAHYVPRIKDNWADPAAHMAAYLPSATVPAFELRFTTDDSAVLDLAREDHRNWVTTLTPDMCAGHDDGLAQSDPDAAWGWCLAQGANILLTDYPAELITYLQNRGRR